MGFYVMFMVYLRKYLTMEVDRIICGDCGIIYRQGGGQ